MRESCRASDGRIYLLVDLKSTMTVMDAWGADIDYFKQNKSYREPCLTEEDFEFLGSDDTEDLPAPKSPEDPV